MNTEIAKEAEEYFGKEKLEALQKEHGELQVAKVGDKFGLFKKPNRSTMSAALSYATTEPMKYLEIIAENCFVAGDRELIEDDEYFFSLTPVLNDLVQLKTAALVKL